MNDASSNLSSAPKHVSFSHSVEMIDDSGVDYVDLPPVIIETMNESDSIMSFTELTETSDQYYDEEPTMAALTQSTNFGDRSMSMSDLYTSSDDMIDAQDVPAAVLPVHNQSDLHDPRIDDDDDGPTPAPTSSSSFWMRYLATLAAIGGAVGFIVHWVSSSQDEPVDNEDAIAVVMATTGTMDKGFLIPSVTADGGATYITYVFIRGIKGAFGNRILCFWNILTHCIFGFFIHRRQCGTSPFHGHYRISKCGSILCVGGRCGWGGGGTRGTIGDG